MPLTKKIYSYHHAAMPAAMPCNGAVACNGAADGSGGGGLPKPGARRGGGLAGLPLHAREALSLPPGSLLARQVVSPAYYGAVTHGYYAEAWGSCSPTGFRRLTLDNGRRPVYNPRTIK